MDETAANRRRPEGVPLADVEKMMMYFTESDAASCVPTPLELNGVNNLQAQYVTRAYETKISICFVPLISG